MPYGYIYLIRCIINEKCYLGQTTKTVERRWKQHVVHSRCPSYHNSILHKAIVKYGANNFEVQTLMACDSQEELDHWEKALAYAFDTFPPAGYNLAVGNGAGAVSQETRTKMSNMRKGRPKPPGFAEQVSRRMKGRKVSDETRAKIRAVVRTPEWGDHISKAKMGTKHTAEERQHQSEIMKGRPLPPEAAAKVRANNVARTGIPMSIEARMKMSAAKLGTKASEETKAKLSAAHLGKKHTEETRRRMSEVQRLRHANNPELGRRVSEAKKAYWAKVHAPAIKMEPLIENRPMEEDLQLGES